VAFKVNVEGEASEGQIRGEGVWKAKSTPFQYTSKYNSAKSLEKSKEQLYADLVFDLVIVWKRDEILLEKKPDLWQRVRIIDDWLYRYRDDPRLSVERFHEQCQKLREIYAMPSPSHDQEAGQEILREERRTLPPAPIWEELWLFYK
jgi:hypothetical protein